VAVVTSGPGFANGFAALPNALSDGVPLLMIASAPPLGEVETNERQGGLDRVTAASPVIKWARRVVTTERIPDLVALAVRQRVCVGEKPHFFSTFRRAWHSRNPPAAAVSSVDESTTEGSGADRPAFRGHSAFS
jgi:acetolactate synthase-1/2/3 large subunit